MKTTTTLRHPEYKKMRLPTAGLNRLLRSLTPIHKWEDRGTLPPARAGIERKDPSMNRLMQEFLEQRLSRRQFVQALTALGISAAGVESLARSAEAVARGT